MKYQVFVSPQDIANGDIIDEDAGLYGSACCPVARAVCRAIYKPLGSISVTSAGNIWMTDSKQFMNKYDKELIKGFVARFDSEKYVEPFTFEIDI